MSYKPTRVGERGVGTELYASEAALLPQGYMAPGGVLPDSVTRSVPGPVRYRAVRRRPAIPLRITSGPVSTPAQLARLMDPRLHASVLVRNRPTIPTVSERAHTIGTPTYGGTPKIIAQPPPPPPGIQAPPPTSAAPPWTRRVMTAPPIVRPMAVPPPSMTTPYELDRNRRVVGRALPVLPPEPTGKGFPTALAVGGAAGAVLLYFLFRK